VKNNKNFEDDWDDLGQELCDNLNRNVLLEHLELVRIGINKSDKTYYEALKIEKYLQYFDKYVAWKYKRKR